MLRLSKCDSPRPVPIPVPPLESTDPFRIVTQPHRPFKPVPIPAESEPPLTDKEPSPADFIVIFESNEHSIPPFASAVETIVLLPDPTIVTELPEIVTAAVVVMLMSSNTIVTSLSMISMPFAVDDPVTTIVPIKG
jgi:hypothetical protein